MTRSATTAPAAAAEPRRVTCPLCGGASRNAFNTSDRNFRVTSESFTYHRCSGCEAVFLGNVPDALGDYYPATYYQNAATDADLRERFEPERYKIDLVQRFMTAGRLLEIGPGSGGFQYLARQAGFEASAIEHHAAAAAWITRNIGTTVHVSPSPKDAVRNLAEFEVIALWHSLEHMNDPWHVVDSLVGHLAPGGIIVVATPNPAAIQLRALGRYWTHLDAPRHTVLIPMATLRTRMRGQELEEVAITTTDPGGLAWDLYGWQVSLRNLSRRPALSTALRRAGRIVALAARPVERTGSRGSAYTAVFRRPVR